MPIIKVKAQPGHQCRLSDSLCVTDKPAEVELTTTVSRRLKDGSLIDCTKRSKTNESD